MENFRKDVRISLLAVLYDFAKDSLAPSYYEECWKPQITTDVLAQAIDDDSIYHQVLEMYLHGLYVKDIIEGTIELLGLNTQEK